MERIRLTKGRWGNWKDGRREEVRGRKLNLSQGPQVSRDAMGPSFANLLQVIVSVLDSRLNANVKAVKISQDHIFQAE